jgi:hypothetical protein
LDNKVSREANPKVLRSTEETTKFRVCPRKQLVRSGVRIFEAQSGLFPENFLLDQQYYPGNFSRVLVLEPLGNEERLIGLERHRYLLLAVRVAMMDALCSIIVHAKKIFGATRYSFPRLKSVLRRSQFIVTLMKCGLPLLYLHPAAAYPSATGTESLASLPATQAPSSVDISSFIPAMLGFTCCLVFFFLGRNIGHHLVTGAGMFGFGIINLLVSQDGNAPLSLLWTYVPFSPAPECVGGIIFFENRVRILSLALTAANAILLFRRYPHLGSW